MSSDDQHYEPPRIEELRGEEGRPAVTAAGGSPYGAITLMDDDEKKDGGTRLARLKRRIRRRG